VDVWAEVNSEARLTEDEHGWTLMQKNEKPEELAGCLRHEKVERPFDAN
jgi:hypothetical protein